MYHFLAAIDGHIQLFFLGLLEVFIVEKIGERLYFLERFDTSSLKK